MHVCACTSALPTHLHARQRALLQPPATANRCCRQVNPGATCLLYNSIGRMAAVGPQTLLLDVCCGTGTIGLTLAKQVGGLLAASC